MNDTKLEAPIVIESLVTLGVAQPEDQTSLPARIFKLCSK